MSSLEVNVGLLKMEFIPQEEDKDAAWEMYIELITRVTTQGLMPEEGDEEAALNSIYELFGITRNIIKNNTRHCQEFMRLAVLILNQRIRPFSSKWHKIKVDQGFSKKNCAEFRQDLEELQVELRKYTAMLGDIIGIESHDFLNMEMRKDDGR